LELVNSNYTAFLSLGDDLRGGDEKVEDVKVALLGFRRAVEEVKGKVTKRREESQSLNNDLKEIRSTIEQGRRMIELSERLSALEEKLALDSLPGASGDQEWDEDDGEESDDDEMDQGKGMLGSSPSKLLASARECSRVIEIFKTLDQDHPFVVRMEERITRCRNTLLLDLGNALKEARKAGVKGQERVMKYLGIYRILDAQHEAVKALRGG
jgi:hypothetical protein